VVGGAVVAGATVVGDAVVAGATVVGDAVVTGATVVTTDTAVVAAAVSPVVESTADPPLPASPHAAAISAMAASIIIQYFVRTATIHPPSL